VAEKAIMERCHICPSANYALGAAEVRSSQTIDLAYTWINEHDFLSRSYARSASENKEPEEGRSPVTSRPRPDGAWAQVILGSASISAAFTPQGEAVGMRIANLAGPLVMAGPASPVAS
jgi:hypothetical protein